MVSLFSTFILLGLAIPALLAPLPVPQDVKSGDTVSSVLPVASSVVPVISSIPSAAPIASPVVSATSPTETRTFVPAPITFGQLTTPSQGGTFDDFIVGSAAPASEQAPARQSVSRSKPTVKRLFPSIFREHGELDRFDAAGPLHALGPAKKPAKGKGKSTSGQAAPAQIQPVQGDAPSPEQPGSIGLGLGSGGQEKN